MPIIDSRPMPTVADSFWQERLGVQISSEETRLLSLLGASPEGLSLTELCTGSGYRSEETKKMCYHLVHQQIIDDLDGETYKLKPYLVDLTKS